ncbi:MAG: nucleotide exchange factor GrpE [Candidatus Poseidoniales archaeon]|nr:MAG: nucleotide exchange factor GrpE [Candidatus Poseidoniales archaeon]
MSEESNEDDPVNQGLEAEADAEPIEGVEPATPVENDGGPSDAPPSENDVEVEEEPRDPLELAVERAEQAEKEIAYRDAEIQNVRKRLMAEKAEVIQFGGMGLARRMLTILGDVDRAMTGIDEDDESPIAQGLRLLRNKMWHELQADGVSVIDAKAQPFDPSKMEAITTIPSSEHFEAGHVVDVLEQGYMYKSKVIMVARVVVASE